MQPATLAVPVPLTPSVIKSLAHKLRAQPGMETLSVSASLKVMAHTLGYASWHAVGKSHSAAHAGGPSQLAPVSDRMPSSEDRRRFYHQMANLLDQGIDIISALAWLEEACTRWGAYPAQADMALRMRQAMLKDCTFSQAAEIVFGSSASLEVFALRTGEESMGLVSGLRAAQEMIP